MNSVVLMSEQYRCTSTLLSSNVTSKYGNQTLYSYKFLTTFFDVHVFVTMPGHRTSQNAQSWVIVTPIYVCKYTNSWAVCSIHST